MEKERDDKAQQKKKSENNKADIKEEVDGKIQDLKKRISGIVATLEEKESLESSDFLVDELCDRLDFILNNKSFVPKESYTKIKDASELFEKNVYEKAKSMDGPSVAFLRAFAASVADSSWSAAPPAELPKFSIAFEPVVKSEKSTG